MVRGDGSFVSILFSWSTYRFLVLTAAGVASVLTLGCGRGEQGIETHSVSSTGAPEMENREKAYVVYISDKKTPLLRGRLSTRDLKIAVDSQAKKVKIIGTVSLAKSSQENGNLNANKEASIELEGTYDEQGIGRLYPSNKLEGSQTLRARAMITCLDKNSGDCKKVVADIFVNDPTSETYHLTQVQSEDESTDKGSKQPNNLLGKTGAPTAPGSDSEGVPDLYVGSAYTNFDTLFENAPTASSTPASVLALDRPTDQAIGQPDNGQLRNPSDLFERIAATQAPLELPNKFRERFYGTYELVEFLIQMGFQSQKLQFEYNLQVSDLSQKSGGHLINSLHVSHQNGLDADVGYFISDRESTGEDFPNVVEGKSLRNDFLTGETLKYFHKLFLTSNGAIDRIFVNQVIKEGFCKKAKDPAFLAAVDRQENLPETLRRLRVWDGHDDHFHLRLKCTKYHPRCRQMTEPPQGTGCN